MARFDAFAGQFSSESIKDRVNDCKAKVVVTSDGGYRRGKILALKKTVDEGIEDCATVQKVLVVAREPQKQLHPVEMKDNATVRARVPRIAGPRGEGTVTPSARDSVHMDRRHRRRLPCDYKARAAKRPTEPGISRLRVRVRR